MNKKNVTFSNTTQISITAYLNELEAMLYDEPFDPVATSSFPTLATTPQQIVHTQIAEADDCDECAGPDHQAFKRRIYEKPELAQISVIRREACGP